MKPLLIIPLVFLCGCSGTALRHTYADYSQVYADSVNKQLVLNLARLSHDEPPYFIQLGQMNSQFTFNGSFGFTPSHARITHPNGVAANIVQDNLTFGGSIGGAATETPTFQFVPLNGEAFAQAVDTPISDKLFYTLFDQGFHANTLVRTIVTSIRFSDTNGIIKILVNHPYSSTYAEFLRFCEKLYRAQVNRQIIVESTDKLSDAPVLYRDVKLSETLAASAAGYIVKNGPSANAYYVTASHKSFMLKPGPEKGAGVATFSAAEESAFLTGKVEFQMRTFIAAMYAVAKEEVYFRERVRTNHDETELKFTKDANGYLAWSTNGTSIAVRPVLTLTGFDLDQRAQLTKLVELTYHKMAYTVGDSESEEEILSPIVGTAGILKAPRSSNRSVFSLLSYLFAQNAIDPQKLPVQQLIQVH
jgi:hypothetical protein